VDGLAREVLKLLHTTIRFQPRKLGIRNQERYVKRLVNFVVLLVLLTVSAMAFGQAISINGGSIQGTITDPTGARVPGAAITVTGTETGEVKHLTTDSAGFYSVGPLTPGRYKVEITAPGFQVSAVTTTVLTGTSTSGNFKLFLGSSNTTIEVNAAELQINTDQSTVSGVLTRNDLETLPVNGRNFLDYAQLQPGVQLQNADSGAGGFDPTKAGYSALSFSGVSGRTTRILLDGQDITDETVGTTIFNVASGSIGEMQINRSNADPSVDIGSSGSVIASTQSGTNAFHGQAFYNFQDYRVGFASVKGANLPFQRNQFGGGVGGPIIKDKLFFFGDSERIKQTQSSPSTIITGPGALFTAIRALNPSLPAPAKDTYSDGRLDYNGPWGVHMFARINYEVNAFAAGAGQLYDNRDNAVGYAFGADFITGKFTHSLRGSYEKFHNLIADASSSPGLYDPIPGFALDDSQQGLSVGPNGNTNQGTFQSDKQIRYDGSWTKGRHNLRYGGEVNRILGGGYASFFANGPDDNFNSGTLIPGTDGTNPLTDYTTYYVYLGNGQGSSTEIPQFGMAGGGQGDWRLGFYLQDSWKVKPSLTLLVGVRYDRDTGRTDSDLAPIPCSAVDVANFGGTAPCTGSAQLLDQFGAGLGNRISQPNKNFGPQAGFNYTPTFLKSKTSIRGGVGMYYENNVFNNVLFDRPSKLASGHFLAYDYLCLGGKYSLDIAGQGLVSQNSAGQSIQSLCSEPIGTAAAGFQLLQNDYQTAAKTSVGANPSYIGETLNFSGSNEAFAPNYKSPYSINFNIGVQQQIFKGAVLTADYVHMGTFRIEQTIDANHVGDSRYLNTTAAQNAIITTVNSFGCGTTASQTTIDCAIAAGATIADFAGNGLDSGDNFLSNNPASALGLTPDTGAAFAGINPNVGVGMFEFPTGQSRYDGLQVNYRQQKTHPFPGLLDSTVEVSYAYSRFITTAGVGGTGSTSDQFFSPPARDYRDATRFMGYGSLDDTHIFSLGVSGAIKYGLHFGVIGHLNSAPPTDLTLDATGNGGVGQIFNTDVTGDGTTGDLLPGTRPGAYMRDIKPKTLHQAIANYNATEANQLTPAGTALITAGLFTQQELQQLGAVTPVLYNGNTARGAFGNSPYRQVDLSFSYPIGHGLFHFLPEKVSLEPQVSIYNALNLGNFNGPIGTLLTPSDVGAGNVNSDYSGIDTRNSYRITRDPGTTFAQGAPRSTEFTLKANF
jgi:hypothetical protein